LESQTKTLAGALGNLGRGGDFSAVQKQLDAIGGGAFSNSEKYGLTAGMMERHGIKFENTDYLASIEQGARAKKAGISGEKLPAFLDWTLQLGKESKQPGGGLEKLSGDELGDLAGVLTQAMPGGVSDKALELLAQAPNKKAMLASIAAAT